MAEELTAPRRRMTKAEAAVKKRLFAEYLLDVKTRRTRDEIIAELDLAPSTYDAWAADPDMVEWAGIETWRYSEAAKHYVRIHQSTALRTLVNVMENSPNDNARVRAAETFLAAAANVQETKTDSTAEEVAKLLGSRQPTMIVGSINITHNQAQPPEQDDEYEVVDVTPRQLSGE